MIGSYENYNLRNGDKNWKKLDSLSALLSPREWNIIRSLLPK